MSTLKQMVGIVPIERVFPSLVVVRQQVSFIPSTRETSMMHRTRDRISGCLNVSLLFKVFEEVILYDRHRLQV